MRPVDLEIKTECPVHDDTRNSPKAEMADDVGQENKLAGGAGAGAGNLRRRRRGREEDESKLYLLSAPPEVLSVIMLFLEGATLAQASCVSKVGFARKSCTEGEQHAALV